MATTTGDRILTLDVIRGIAVMGILSVNIVGMAMIEDAYFFPDALRLPLAGRQGDVGAQLDLRRRTLPGAVLDAVRRVADAGGDPRDRSGEARLAGALCPDDRAAAVRLHPLLLAVVGRHPGQLRPRRHDRLPVLATQTLAPAALRGRFAGHVLRPAMGPSGSADPYGPARHGAGRTASVAREGGGDAQEGDADGFGL